MIPEPKQDNTLMIIGGLIIILIIALGAYILLTPKDYTAEETDGWVAEEGVELTPNATAIIIMPEECPDCGSSLVLLKNLQSDWADLGTNVVESGVIYDTSEEGRNMIIRYDIEKLPALVLRKEGQWDSRILSTWLADIGSVEDDGSLVQREVIPPYFDTSTDTVRGKVEFILLTDNSCRECYNVSLFASDLVNMFGFNVKSSTTYDLSSVEGNAITYQYDITAAPTFLVSEDAGLYEGFDDFWFRRDNTQEEDGWHVFRDVQYLGVQYLTVSANESG